MKIELDKTNEDWMASVRKGKKPSKGKPAKVVEEALAKADTEKVKELKMAGRLDSLRSRVIRLAHAKPELRKDLLPLVRKGMLEGLPAGGVESAAQKIVRWFLFFEREGLAADLKKERDLYALLKRAMRRGNGETLYHLVNEYDKDGLLTEVWNSPQGRSFQKDFLELDKALRREGRSASQRRKTRRPRT